MPLIFFLCATIYSATEVAHSNPIYNITPLPPGCFWTTNTDNYGRQATEIIPVDVVRVEELWFSVARVYTRSAGNGYSVGKPYVS